MKRGSHRLVLALMLAPSCVAVSGCGGGGGSGGSNAIAVSASLSAIGVEQRVSELAKTVAFSVTATSSPSGGLYADLTWSGNAINTANWASNAANRADITVELAAPGDLTPGLHTGTLDFKVCADDRCNQQVANSPLRIPVSLVVRSADPVQVSASPSEIVLARKNYNGIVPFVDVAVSMSPALVHSPHVNTSYSGDGVLDSVAQLSVGESSVMLQVRMVPTANLADGTYRGLVDVELCYTASCVNKITESPLRLPLAYTVAPVNTLPEPGVAPIVPRAVTTLRHDVVDAEYSKGLDAVVMVSTYPFNAIHVYEVDQRTEKSVALAAPPTSVSVGPDGRSAAVGHDGFISHVNLDDVIAGAVTPKLLNVSTNVFDVVLDGRGFAHAFPKSDQWVNMHTVHIATNTESIGNGQFYDRERARLHPSGDYIYAANNGLSPSEIEKFAITTVPTSYLYDSPYHGEYDMCGNLWFSEDGLKIFTPCGNVFDSSTTPAGDMLYAATLKLSQPSRLNLGYWIRSLSESALANEIAVVEYDVAYCPTLPTSISVPCWTHLALFDANSLDPLATYSFGPMLVDGVVYGQEGFFVFHSYDGSRKFLISKLERMANRDKEYYLTEL